MMNLDTFSIARRLQWPFVFILVLQVSAFMWTLNSISLDEGPHTCQSCSGNWWQLDVRRLPCRLGGQESFDARAPGSAIWRLIAYVLDIDGTKSC